MSTISATRAAQEKMIMRHFVDAAEAAEQLEQTPHLGFRDIEDARDVANARRAETIGATQ